MESSMKEILAAGEETGEAAHLSTRQPGASEENCASWLFRRVLGAGTDPEGLPYTANLWALFSAPQSFFFTLVWFSKKTERLGSHEESQSFLLHVSC